MAVEILRRRWFGTEVSSSTNTGFAVGTRWQAGDSGTLPVFTADEVDVTSEVAETGVMMRNRERIATL
jgi:hypothetical protein